MRRAIQKAKEGIKKGQTPFGACIVKDGRVVSCAHNIVWKSCDITAHAEVNAIRQACRKLKTIDLSGCVIYSTCEPCPMCFSACHWARISEIIYGAEIKDAKRFGFNELTVSVAKLKSLGKTRVRLQKHLLHQENLELFRLWVKLSQGKTY